MLKSIASRRFPKLDLVSLRYARGNSTCSGVEEALPLGPDWVEELNGERFEERFETDETDYCGCDVPTCSP
jgi:hypothetical protein